MEDEATRLAVEEVDALFGMSERITLDEGISDETADVDDGPETR